jgi:serine/threonine protein kinase
VREGCPPQLANVFVSNLLDFKLGDLGVAKHLAWKQNETQTFAGTPVYMAPEVLANLPYSVQSDMFSLGLLLFELCTQQRMFHPTSWTNLSNDVRRPLRVSFDVLAHRRESLLLRVSVEGVGERVCSTWTRIHAWNTIGIARSSAILSPAWSYTHQRTA